MICSDFEKGLADDVLKLYNGTPEILFVSLQIGERKEPISSIGSFLVFKGDEDALRIGH